MKKYFGWLLVAAGIFGLSLNANAAGGSLKIGYFDANAAAMQSQWGKRIADDIKKEQEKLGGELDAKGKSVKAASDEYDKKKDVMDEKARLKKQKELQDMMADLQKTANETSQKFNEERTRALKPLYDKMLEIINKIGKDDKYDYILEKGAVVFTGSDRDDLTKRVASELDRGAPR
jgi:outer membrane protein